MAQHVKLLRGFFSAFFALPQPMWAGFLAGWPGLPGNEYHESWNRRITFALSLFFKMPTEVQLTLMLYAVTYTFQNGPNVLLRSVTPPFLFGSGPKEPVYTPPDQPIGDVEAKEEARRLMKSFKPTIEETSKLYYFEPEKGLLPPPFDAA